MKIFSKSIIAAAFIMLATSLHADTSNEDFAAMVNAEAARMDQTEQALLHEVHDVKLAMKQLREISPVAYLAIANLQPHHQSEVLKAMREGRDVYEIRELVLERLK